MTTHVNVAAQARYKGLFKTKKELREALRNSPRDVLFVGASSLGPQLKWPVHGDDIPLGYSFSVAGPHPATDRRWYATVTRGKDGNPVIR